MSTHIQQVRAQFAYNRMQILWLTKMSDAMLSQFQFDTGLQWLTMYTACADDVMRWAMSQPLVWKWWMNEWNRRDEEYLPMLHDYYRVWPKETLAKYRAMHQECFIPFALPWTLLEDGYAKAIGDAQRVTKIKGE